MVKVITYGTYDMLHYGHIRLMERAKALGDYLIVGITSSDYDKYRGKINVEQPLVERIKAVKETGIPDEIIVEEYEGQKINDIISYGVDIFAIGSDWKGKFDYLNEYCKVVYLDRTEGISSSEIRTKENKIRIGVAGDAAQEEFMKYVSECGYVNGAEVTGIYSEETASPEITNLDHKLFDSYDELLDACDAVREMGINAGIILLEKIKPYGECAENVARLLPWGVRKIIFLEEEIRAGGMGMNLADEMKRRALMPCAYEIMAVDDSFVPRHSGNTVYDDARLSSAFLKESLAKNFRKNTHN
jgi:choline-phosphate cytidylyltransferase